MLRLAGRVIGLTGNIGSGKSTAAQMLREEGAAVIDADQIARQITEKGQTAHDEVMREFGTVDRAKLRALVFQDEASRKKLESILHPAIAAESRKQTQALLDAGHKLVIYEATLLIEAQRQKDFSGLLVVTADQDKQIERILARDKSLTHELAEKIIASQMPQQEKAKLADWVIENNGTLEELRSKVKSWMKQI